MIDFELGEDDDAAEHIFGAQLSGDFEPGQFGKVDIEHDDVGMEFDNAIESGLSIIGLTDDLKTRVATDCLAKALSKKRMIVDDQRADQSLTGIENVLPKRLVIGEGELC